MSFTQHRLVLAGDTPGTETTLYSYAVGPEDAGLAEVHLQAALHADEQPGTMVLHHLLPLLRAADEAGALRARFRIFPSVNPLGLGSWVLHGHLGRYDAASGVNHNRRWPDLYPLVAPRLAGRLGADAAENVALIRQAVAAWIAEQRPATARQRLRLAVLESALWADIVLDLHCDSDSLMHIFVSPELMPGLQDLADWMGAAAVLTAEDSGGGSFDEMLPRLFREAGRANPGSPVPPAAAAATLEYRGQADTFDALGREDARRLFGFFAGRGLIAADAGPRPKPAPAATPFEATEIVRAERPGLVAYRVELGQRVRRGEVIADLIAMDGPEAFLARTPIRAGTDGFVLSRALGKYVPAGGSLAKIVGTEVLPARAGGYLLED